MPLSTNVSLNKEFENWKKSHYFLKLFQESDLNNKIPKPKIEAGLENAFMFQVNNESKLPNINLLTKEAVAFGFACVEIQLEENKLKSFVESSKRKINALDFNSTSIEIGRTERYFFASDFQLDVNQYTIKAFNYLKEERSEVKSIELLLTSALRYASIFAKTRHIGPPQETYNLFYEWGVRNEAFASPFNARLLGKEKVCFFSLFEDTDGVFGSKGSLFEVDSPTINKGDWCFDPPFIKELMEEAVERLNQWRKEYPKINFILIVPDWFKPKLEFNEKVLLKKNIHFCEGLDGVKKPLPVDVGIYLIGNMDKFSAEKIKSTYSID